jgi:WD40 repeat protein/transcriptional regulator with XRE-family HTH domain
VDGAEPNSFGELLRWFRIQAGLTQEDLAERAGLSARGVQDLERGLRRSPYPATTRRLAEALELGDTERTVLFSAVGKTLTNRRRAERDTAGRLVPHRRTGASQPVEVVLCYAPHDRPVVDCLAAGLWSAGLVPRVDSALPVSNAGAAEQLARGQTVCLVFVGAAEDGAYDLASLGLTPHGAVGHGQRLIPVLLHGAPDPLAATALPPGLATRPWVDLRATSDVPQAVQRLVAAIRGVPALTAGRAEPRGAAVCPYRGLEVFNEEHAGLFFGREAEVQRLLEYLKSSRFLAVVAPSGGGKSSLVRAGLLPALRAGALPASDTWKSSVLTPGPEPLTALAAAVVHAAGGDAMQPTLDLLAEDARTLHLAGELALAHRPRAARLVWVVDQFEEVFTQCWDEQEGAQFVANLLYAATVPSGRSVVVLTMRADVYARCTEYPELAACIAAHQHLLGPMDEYGFRQAIEGPAQRTGLTFEPGLVDTILDDVAGEPGALPLLEYALMELWRHRHGNALTFDGYAGIGGVQGALALRAESVYGNLSPAEQGIAQRLLLRLTEPGDGTEDSRRRAPVAELETVGTTRDDTERVVSALAEARLLVTAADAETHERYVEVAHEALIRHWPRLRQWVDDDRAALRAHRRLNESACEWQRLNREDEALLRGARLAEALEWRQHREHELNALEHDFLEASAAFEDRQRRTRDHQRKLVTAILAVGLSVALLLAGISVLQWRHAEDARQVALSQELAFQADIVRAGLAVELPRSVLLAIEGFRRAPSPQAERALRADLALLAKPIVSMAHPARVQAIAYSPDGQQLATASFDGLAHVWDPVSGRELMALQHDGPVQALDYSPDGRELATGSDDGTARVWDAGTGQQLFVLRHADRVYSVAFSPDGHYLASTTRDGAVFVWDTATGKNTAHMAHSAPLPRAPFGSNGATRVDAPGPAIAFSSDSRLLVTGRSEDAAARVWDVATGRQVALLQHDGIVEGMAFQPGGSLVATASMDGFVKLWDASSGQEIARLAMDKNSPAYRVAFSPDGHTVAAAGNQFNAKTWETATGRELVRLPHSDTVQALAFSPDGRTIGTAGNESAAHLWDAASGREVGRVAVESASNVYALAFSPDSRQLAVVSDDNRVSVWEATKPWQVTGLQHDALVNNAAFSPDGHYLATGSADGSIRLWDASTGDLRRRWDTGGAVYPVRFTTDGEYLASASYDGNAYVMDLSTGEEVARLAQGDVVFDAAISPSGRLLATGTASGQVRVWDWRTGQNLLRTQHDGGVQGVYFSSDERRLATASLDGTVRVWDLDDGRELLRMASSDRHPIYSMGVSKDGRYIATGEIGAVRLWDVASGREELQLPHDSLVNGVAISDDGRLLATAGRDGTVRLFELPSGHELDSMAHGLSANGVAFSPDGELLVTASDDRTARVWAVAPGNLLAEACGAVIRSLSAEEWQRYLPDQPYRRTCADVR